MGVMRWQRHSAAVTRTARWKGLRLMALRRDGWACAQCGARGRLEVDHVTPVRTAPERAFDLTNTRKTRLECGHPPLSDERQKWRAAVAQMMKGNDNA